MEKVTSFFFSKILYKEVHNISGQTIGKLNDLILDFNQDKPTVIYMQITNGRKAFYTSAEALIILKDKKERYYIEINSENIAVRQPDDKDIYLAKNFLDKQIVDINGKKIERVNDVRLGSINYRWQLLAVDIGTRGLLRRLGIEYPFIILSGAFNYQLRNRLIIWDNVQPLSNGIDDLKLHFPANKIETLHAADIADIIEDLDNKNRNVLFNSLNNEKAAEVLEEIETDVQVNLIKSMSDKKASDILGIMPSDEVADIFEEIEEGRAQLLLSRLNTESQGEIRELMEYEKETIGSIMSKDFITLLPDITVKDAIDWIQMNVPEEEESHYIYVTNNKNRLLGVIPLFLLITSKSDTKLYNIITSQPNTVNDNDTLEDALKILEKYNLVSLPVVDENNSLIGTVSLNDIIQEHSLFKKVAL